MPHFNYTAINENGEKVNGALSAESLEAAESSLANQGLMPLRLKEAKDGGEGGSLLSRLSFGQKVKFRDVLIFSKQLRTLLAAGIPISQGLEILSQQTESAYLKKILTGMIADINGGSTLAHTFGRHPEVFSKLYCSLIEAGEVSGSLLDVLERLTYIMERENRIKEDINSALTYPKMVMVTLFGAFLFLLTFVMPQFAVIFQKAGVELPLPTKICIFMYENLLLYWAHMLVAASGLFIAVRLYLRTESGLLVKGRLQLAAPIIGPLFLKSAMSRFSGIMSILLASGVTVLQSLKIISGVIGNAAISREFDGLATQIEEGRGISAPLRKAAFFPPLVVNMVAVGEESGSLDEMLTTVARHYDEEVEYAVKGLTEAIGPIMMVALAGVVGFFALAIFLPMWDLISTQTKM